MHDHTTKNPQLPPFALSRRGFLCLLYTSDAADDPPRLDPGGRLIIQKKKTHTANHYMTL